LEKKLLFYLLTFLINTTVYERELVISNPADSLLTDVQIEFNLDTRSLINNAKLDLEGHSLRIFRKGNPAPCWIADSVHSCSTNIWLKMDSLFSGETQLTLLYCDSTDSHTNPFDYVFTKARVEDYGKGWVFHCDEGEGEISVSCAGENNLTLQAISWEEEDGGGWGTYSEQTFETGSALYFEPGSVAKWDFPPEILRDSFTIALWLRLDTMEYLAYSSSKRVLLERPDAFSLWLLRGALGFSLENAIKPRSCHLPPFGWERLDNPDIPDGFLPQGLSTMGDKLLFSAYSKNPALSRVWRVDPTDIAFLDWFDMPDDATHTSGLAYDSTRGILWAADYNSNKLYVIDPDSSFLIHKAVVRGKFGIYRKGLSACCFASYQDTLRLMVSTYGEGGRTYVIDEQALLNHGEVAVLAQYKNTGSSQGLAFDGEYLWESNNSTLIQLDLEKAIQSRHYTAGIISYWSEPPLVEDLAFLHDTLWTSSESWSRDFYRLTDDPGKFLGRWMHVVATYDGQMLRLYSDGELKDSAKVEGPKDVSASPPLFIGAGEDGKSSFEGSIDEIVILPGVLDSIGIRALFERRKSMPEEPSFYVEEEEDSLPNLGEVVEELSDPLGIETGSANIILVIPYEQKIQVDLFDATGRRIAALLPPTRAKNKVELRWPHGISAGVYHVVVSSEDETFSRKIVFLK
jgi:hypothetical protein